MNDAFNITRIYAENEGLKEHIAEQYRFISDLEDAVTNNGDLINRLSKERDEFAATIANFARNKETNLADLCCKSSDVINKIKADAIRDFAQSLADNANPPPASKVRAEYYKAGIRHSISYAEIYAGKLEQRK